MHRPPLTAPRLAAALATAAELYGVPPLALLGRGRSRPVSHARQMVMAALYQACQATTPQIGLYFSRDHTTVLHNIYAARARAVEDPAVALDLAQIAAEASQPLHLLEAA